MTTAVDRYATAFSSLGGYATASMLAEILGVTVQAAHQFLTRHTGTHVRSMGKVKAGAFYQWIKNENQAV